MDSIEKRLAILEARVAHQEDHTAIRQLIASYGPLVDTSDCLERSTQLSQLWAEDGVYDIGGFGAQEGRDTIARSFEGLHFAMVREGVCHVMGLPYIRVEGDEATALNYSCVFRPETGTKERFYAWRVSANRWELKREEGRWRVVRRTNRLMTGDGEALAILRHIDDMIDTGDVV